MIFESKMTERQLIDEFLDTLRALPQVQVEPGYREPVTQVNLHVADKSFTLLIEVKKAVYPRDVRQILWQCRGDEAVSILVAESISPGAKDLLRRERIGFYDSGGSLFLPARGVYLYIDKPPAKTLLKSMGTLFSGRRAQVLHTLLMRHQDWFGGKDLAEQALVSPATASQVLAELERLDWLVSRGQGPNKERHLSEPAALLDAWALQLTSMRAPALRRYYVPAMNGDTLLKKVAEVFARHEVEYAISFEAAAQCYAPFLSSVSQVRTRLVVGIAANAAIGELGARVVTEGANFAMIEAKSPGELLYREQVDGIWLASPIQVYLDLLQGEGRTKEMADHLRKEKLGF
jgi:hypothetical protein